MHLRQKVGAGRLSTFGFAVSLSLMGLVGGCASERPNIPDSAMLKAQGNDRVVFTADQPGNVWVGDKASNKIAYSGRLNTGDRVVVDTKRNLLTVNDRAVVTKDLPRHDYKVYFEPGLAVPAAARVTDQDAIKSDLKRPKTVPMSASLVGEGRDRVEYTAPADGDVWIVNTNRNELTYSGRVMPGEQVMVDPKHDQLAIGSRSGLVDRANLPDDNYRIFYMRSTDRPAAVLPATPPEAGARTGTVVVPVTPPARPGASESPAVAPPDPRATIRAGEAPVAVVERPGTIPAGAITWSDSKDRTNLTATDPGTAWVVDDSNRIVYTTRMVKGDTLAIDPANDQILLNGSRAYDGRLTAGRYRVYYEKTAR